MPRLFVAMPVPQEVQHPLDRLCQGLPAIRWTDPDDRHLTLRFIGNVDGASFVEIGEALNRVRGSPMHLHFRRLGHFPPRGEPNVVWVAVEPMPELLALRRAINRALYDAGIGRDERKYMPHVTIGRFYAPPPLGRFAAYMQRRALFTSKPFIASEFCLYSAYLRPEGADYRIEATYDFVTGAFEQH